MPADTLHFYRLTFAMERQQIENILLQITAYKCKCINFLLFAQSK